MNIGTVEYLGFHKRSRRGRRDFSHSAKDLLDHSKGWLCFWWRNDYSYSAMLVQTKPITASLLAQAGAQPSGNIPALLYWDGRYPLSFAFGSGQREKERVRQPWSSSKLGQARHLTHTEPVEPVLSTDKSMQFQRTTLSDPKHSFIIIALASSVSEIQAELV